MNNHSLYLKQNVSDGKTKSILKNCLDEWVSHVPFSPIKVFSQETKVVDITEFACYTVILTTQTQDRFFTAREIPYQEESIPETPLTDQDFDIWSMEFPLKADFRDHDRSRDLPDTEHVYKCSTCHAEGILRCSNCSGSGKLECKSCYGSGFQIKHERIPYEKPCNCGNGRESGTDRPCSWCKGSGRIMDYRNEERRLPCMGGCAATGKVDCNGCLGAGTVTCDRCQGARRLLGYLTADQAEKTFHDVMYYIPPELSKFGKDSSPVSDISGTDVFVQDEMRLLSDFKIGGQPASDVLAGLAEKCREDSAKHSGRIERQRLSIQRCSVYEYRYRHNKRDYLVYINPVHKLVKDIDGPIATSLEKTGVEALDFFNRGQLAEAYRANLIALSRGGTEKDKNLRGQIQNSLFKRHISITAITSFIASVTFFRGQDLLESLGFSICCSVFASMLFIMDPMIRMKSWQAKLVSVLIGLNGSVLFVYPEFVDIGKLFLISLPTARLLYIRKEFDKKLCAIEESQWVREKNTHALETFINELRPSYRTATIWFLCLGLLFVFLLISEMQSR